MNNVEFVKELIDDKKIAVLAAYDVTSLGTFADVFVIALAQNDRQIAGLITAFKEKVTDREHTLFIEGEPRSGWVAIQYQEVCAHIFLQDAHETYRIDTLFSDLPQV